jgi:hypothetical protein
LPFSQFNSISQSSGAIAAANAAGAMENVLLSSGATGLTLPSASQIYQAV